MLHKNKKKEQLLKAQEAAIFKLLDTPSHRADAARCSSWALTPASNRITKSSVGPGYVIDAV